MTIRLTGEDLTVDQVVAVAREHARVEFDESALAAVGRNRAALTERLDRGDRIYGVNTGFGANADVSIDAEDVEALQANLLRSHAVGVGDPLSEAEVRATMLCRCNSLLAGNSGVRERVVTTLRDVLDADVYPYVPRKGSVSASGDLAPLAHVALVLVGEGRARVADGEGSDRDGDGDSGGDDWLPGDEALAVAGVDPLTLKAKEGLALVNGTNVVTALGALAVHDARILADTADTVGAMTLEAQRGISDAFRPEIHDLRGHEGQRESARRVRAAIEGSDLVTTSAASAHVQDQYSLRCLPQVHGATRDVVSHVAGVIERELNAVTDNPLVLDDGEVLSGGNFHAQPVALALDSLSSAVAELADISERRLFQLVGGGPDGPREGLPAFLVGDDDPGLNSGFMIPQVTAAALVSENRTLSHPSATDSIPTSNNQEDHVSMGMNAANHLTEVLENVRTVLAIEAFAAYQGLWHRENEDATFGAGTRRAYDRIGDLVAPVERDRELTEDLDAVTALVRGGALR